MKKKSGGGLKYNRRKVNLSWQVYSQTDVGIVCFILVRVTAAANSINTVTLVVVMVILVVSDSCN